MKRRAAGVCLVALSAVVAAGCGSGSDDSSQQEAALTTATTPNPEEGALVQNATPTSLGASAAPGSAEAVGRLRPGAPLSGNRSERCKQAGYRQIVARSPVAAVGVTAEIRGYIKWCYVPTQITSVSLYRMHSEKLFWKWQRWEQNSKVFRSQNRVFDWTIRGFYKKCAPQVGVGPINTPSVCTTNAHPVLRIQVNNGGQVHATGGIN